MTQSQKLGLLTHLAEKVMRLRRYHYIDTEPVPPGHFYVAARTGEIITSEGVFNPLLDANQALEVLVAIANQALEVLVAIRADHAAGQKREQSLRRLLFRQHPCSGKYADDGEMQCSNCRIDFRRDDPKGIEERIVKLARAALAKTPDDPGLATKEGKPK